MRQAKIGLALWAILLAYSCGAHPAQAAMGGAQEFSADMYSRTGTQVMQAKLYYAKDKMRMETAGSIMITRLDKDVTWVVMSSEQMYMEQPINKAMLPKASKDMEGELERVSLGMESVDGAQAEKFKVTYAEGSGRASAYQWVLASGFPVKMEAVDGSWSVEYKNIKLGPQPADLFEPPAGYQKLALPFGDKLSGGPSLDDFMSQAKDRLH